MCLKSKKIIDNCLALLIILIVSFSAFAEEFELEHKAVSYDQDKLNIMRYIAYTDLAPMMEPGEDLIAEPKYRSRSPIYTVANFGNDEDNKYTLVFDEKGGTGRGYDTLYIDLNNNEDLTDDQKIFSIGRARRSIKNEENTVELGPINVMINYGNKVSSCCFYAQLQISYRKGINTDSNTLRGNQVNIRLRSGGYFTGDIQFGESKSRIAVIDYNNNGIFNDLFKVQPEIKLPDKYLYASGDMILVNIAEDKQYQDFRPYAKYIQIDDSWYSLSVSEDGRKVEVNEANPNFGTIKTEQNIDSLQLNSDNGVIVINSKSTNEFQIPVGTYQLYECSMRLADPSLLKMQFNVRGTESCRQFQVEKGKVFEMKIGFPIVANVQCTTNFNRDQLPIKAGDSVNLSLTFSGQMGERFVNILFNNKDNTRIPRPTFKAVDEEGKVVAEGTFQYG